MNILLLNGSPKANASNTLKAADAFIQGLAAGQSNEVVRVNLSEKQIKDCSGCFCCWTKTPGTCIHRDDMDVLLPQFIKAELVIWSFPLYYFGMPSRIKAFMDRLLPTNMPTLIQEDGQPKHPTRYDFSHQKHILISTCGFHTAAHNYEALEMQFDIAFGDKVTSILCPQGELLRVPELSTDAFLEKIRQAGQLYGKTGALEKEYLIALRTPMLAAEVYMEMANASWEIAANTAAAADQEPKDCTWPYIRQMGALCNHQAAQGKELVLEMHFTDADKTYQFHIANGGCKTLQGTPLPYTTRIETPFGVWQDIAQGRLDGVQAMMDHKYRVLGSFDTMLIMNSLFSLAPSAGAPADSSPASAKPTLFCADGKKTNMLILLLPWLALWIAAPFHPQVGAALTIGLSLLLAVNPLFLHTPYETATAIALTTLGLAVLLNPAAAALIIVLSKLLWAGMWIFSVFRKIPLCAYYSCYGNGFDTPEAALNNCLFLKTNRLLAGAWGLQSLTMSLAAWIFLSGPYAPVFTLLDQISPLLMGIFTIWFAKWYPRKVAFG